MILFPNAKINIGLNVLRRRPDGYHDLDTLFYPIGWSDVLEIVPASGECATLTVTGRAVDCRADGAGLGGGSSDAAFTLRGLNEMFALGMTDADLAGVAVTIGADCPFFIYNRPMFASGIGDLLRPAGLSLDGYLICVVKPDESVSTREAYSGVVPSVPLVPLSDKLSRPVENWRGEVANDFEKSVFPLHPVIESVKERLYGLGAVYASMSGSGAAVYGIFPSDYADRLSAIVTDEFPDMSVWL